jgi:Tol biopolymer transport system component
MGKVKILVTLLCSVFVSVFFVLACSSSGPKLGERAKKDRKGYSSEKGGAAPEVKLWNLNGVNNGLSVLDQNQLVYSSRLRDAHVHAQIYRFNVDNGKETRVTFSDGNSQYPIWVLRKQNLYYASDTDESKERSEFIAKNIDPIKEGDEIPSDRSEIYSSDVFGNHIKRLTRSPGFDGDHDYHPNKDLLVFISKRDGAKDIYLLVRAGSVQRITQTKEDESSPRFSPDGKQMAWVETTPKEKSMLLLGWPGRKRDVLLIFKDEPIEGVTWSSNEHVLFSARIANGVSQVFELNVNNKCLKRLTNTDYPVEFPAVSGKQLYFIARKDGKSQLGRQSYDPPEKCIDTSVDPLILKE